MDPVSQGESDNGNFSKLINDRNDKTERNGMQAAKDKRPAGAAGGGWGTTQSVTLWRKKNR